MKKIITILLLASASLTTTHGQGFGTLRQSGFTLIPGTSESYFESNPSNPNIVRFIGQSTVGFTTNNSWFAFNGFQFNQGGGVAMEVQVAKGNGGTATLEIRTSGTNTATPGALVGSTTITNTGGWGNFKTYYIPFNTTVTGIKNLYFQFKGGAGFLMDIGKYTVIPNNPVEIIKTLNPTNYALDGGNGGGNGQNVYLWQFTSNNVNQEWKEINRGGGYFSYLKKNTGFALDGGNGGGNGQNVYIWETDADNANQQWKQVIVGSQQFRLEKRNAPAFSIDSNNGGSNGQNVYLWQSDSSNFNQRFLIGDF